jgi:hypothetical protein
MEFSIQYVMVHSTNVFLYKTQNKKISYERRGKECKAAMLDPMYIQHCLFQYFKGLTISTKVKASIPSAHQITGTFLTSDIGEELLIHTNEIQISVQTAI